MGPRLLLIFRPSSSPSSSSSAAAAAAAAWNLRRRCRKYAVQADWSSARLSASLVRESWLSVVTDSVVKPSGCRSTLKPRQSRTTGIPSQILDLPADRGTAFVNLATQASMREERDCDGRVAGVFLYISQSCVQSRTVRCSECDVGNAC